MGNDLLIVIQLGIGKAEDVTPAFLTVTTLPPFTSYTLDFWILGLDFL